MFMYILCMLYIAFKHILSIVSADTFLDIFFFLKFPLCKTCAKSLSSFPLFLLFKICMFFYLKEDS